jgi:hypothetical protein
LSLTATIDVAFPVTQNRYRDLGLRRHLGVTVFVELVMNSFSMMPRERASSSRGDVWMSIVSKTPRIPGNKDEIP